MKRPEWCLTKDKELSGSIDVRINIFFVNTPGVTLISDS